MIIGIAGRAHAGKDAVAGFVLDWAAQANVHARRQALADFLKLSAARIFYPEIEMEAALEWANALKERGAVSVIRPGQQPLEGQELVSGRVFLQRYGTEAHRKVFGEDFWVSELMDSTSDRELCGQDILVVPDVRFVNEAAPMQEVWRVERAGTPITGSDHPSEAGLPDEVVTRVIENNASLAHLRHTVYILLDTIYGYVSAGA